jgi:hypothetical protein
LPGEVHDGLVHTLLFAQDALDAERAGSAGHPFNIERDRVVH